MSALIKFKAAWLVLHYSLFFCAKIGSSVIATILVKNNETKTNLAGKSHLLGIRKWLVVGLKAEKHLQNKNTRTGH